MGEEMTPLPQPTPPEPQTFGRCSVPSHAGDHHLNEHDEFTPAKCRNWRPLPEPQTEGPTPPHDPCGYDLGFGTCQMCDREKFVTWEATIDAKDAEIARLKDQIKDLET